MHCKACNTRLGAGDRHCPNCGRTVRGGASGAGLTTPPEPPPLQGPSPLAQAAEPSRSPENGPETSAEHAGKPAKSASSVRGATPAAPEVDAVQLEPENEVAPPPAAAAPADEPAGSGGAVAFGPAEIRAQIAERPELVEPGLSVWRDPDRSRAGSAEGVGYETEVGEVDLLAVDGSGRLVVVLVVGRDDGDPVGLALERLGWVAKHVAGPDQDVRGVVLLEPPAPALGYAARAVADTVAFKTWRVTVALDDLQP